MLHSRKPNMIFLLLLLSQPQIKFKQQQQKNNTVRDESSTKER